jgi:hypothetical protein
MKAINILICLTFLCFASISAQTVYRFTLDPAVGDIVVYNGAAECVIKYVRGSGYMSCMGKHVEIRSEGNLLILSDDCGAIGAVTSRNFKHIVLSDGREYRRGRSTLLPRFHYLSGGEVVARVYYRGDWRFPYTYHERPVEVAMYTGDTVFLPFLFMSTLRHIGISSAREQLLNTLLFFSLGYCLGSFGF